MKISYNWLQDYIALDVSPQELSLILTGIGLEVESMETFETVKGGMKGVVIGQVKSCRKHPNADKLTLTTVDVGGERLLSIVCGAPNVAEGQKVAVALSGTTLYKEDESFEIKTARIRGELSEGMICAEDELGLGKDHKGIMVLDAGAQIGTPAREYFHIESDTIYEIGLTPNRIESGSHYGVARDLYAYFRIRNRKELRAPDISRFSIDRTDFTIPVEIINPEACPRYTGITFTGIRVGESPAWLKNRLRAIGQNPINNVVDITNYVLHETGQPLHAFDADKIAGGKVVVRTLPAGTPFITLDGVEHTLSPEDLMICNTKEPMCLGGIFGGIETGVTEKTTRVFLESAYFNPVFIRRSSKRHGLSTDASFRFERGADPYMTIYALKRAAMLIREITGAHISSEIVDVHPRPISDPVVSLSFSQIRRLTGVDIAPDVVEQILEAMDMQILKKNTKGLQVRVPSTKVDVTREADLIEEVLRIYGYDQIKLGHALNSSLSFTEKPDKEKLMNQVCDMLVSHGFYEIMNNSLTPQAYYANSSLFPPERTILLHNPLSSDLNAMRQTLLFGGLESILYNTNRQRPDNKFFELGNVYWLINPTLRKGDLENYHEEERLCLWITGNSNPPHWSVRSEPSNFYHLKSYVEQVLDKLGIVPDRFTVDDLRSEVFAEGLEYQADGSVVIEMGMLHPSLLKRFDIKSSVYYADIHWRDLLYLVRDKEITYHELPKFPEVRRDLALLLDKKVRFRQVKDLAFKTEKSILRNVNLFDVYEGEQVGQGKKSYAVSFVLQDLEKTLTDQKIEEVMKKLVRVFEKELGASIR